MDDSRNKPTGRVRRKSSSTSRLTLSKTITRHDFEAQGSAKHIERLESAEEEGKYGVALNVCHPDYSLQIIRYLTF